MSIFDGIKPTFSQLKESAKTASQWWNENINKLKVNAVFDQYKNNRKNKLDPRRSIGKLYYFIYDAKHKESMPWWDQFPLIFVLNTNDKRTKQPSFMGLNFHYLPYKQRLELLSALRKISNSDKIREDKRTMIAFNVVMRYSRLALPCVKTYLNAHVKSQFVEVPKEDWEYAMMLGTAKYPREKFTFARPDGQKVSVPKGDVWTDSIVQAQGGRRITRKDVTKQGKY